MRGGTLSQRLLASRGSSAPLSAEEQRALSARDAPVQGASVVRLRARLRKESTPVDQLELEKASSVETLTGCTFQRSPTYRKHPAPVSSVVDNSQLLAVRAVKADSVSRTPLTCNCTLFLGETKMKEERSHTHGRGDKGEDRKQRQENDAPGDCNLCSSGK